MAVAVVLAPALAAQKTPKVPTRPRLDPGADTNDARSYYQYGVRMIDSKPEESVRAFYWASQIDPSSGEVLYAMRAAALMQMSTDGLVDYLDYSAKKRKPEFLALDSLLYRAYTINPFLYRSLDRSLTRRILEAEIRNENPSIDGAELNLFILRVLQECETDGLAVVRARAISGSARAIRKAARDAGEDQEQAQQARARG